MLYFTVNSPYVMFNILLFGKLIATSLRVIMLVLISRVKEHNNFAFQHYKLTTLGK